jgi:uncharacterized protein YyaL (SSP411 family)
VYETLRAARAARESPFVDSTRYANWNAMLAGALLHAGPILGDRGAVELGLGALRRIRESQREADAVAHSDGGPTGLLDDPVQCAAAAIDAFEATGDRSWLDWSAGLLDRVWQEHWDAGRGGLRDLRASAASEGLLNAVVKPIQDSPNASPNGIAGQTVARLFEHTQDARWHERHAAIVTAFGATAAQLGLFASAHLIAADWLARPATQLVITGSPDDPLAAELHRHALASFAPRRVVVRLEAGASPSRLPPALAALAPSADRARGYVCVGARCLAPVDTLDAWDSALRSILPSSPAS